MDSRVLILPLALSDAESADDHGFMSRQVPVAVRNAVEMRLNGRVVAAPLATEMDGRRMWVVHRRMWGVDRAARFGAARNYTHVVCGELDTSDCGWALDVKVTSVEDGAIVAQLHKEGDVFQLVRGILGAIGPVIDLDPSAAMSLFEAPTDEASVYERYMHGLDVLLSLRSPGMQLDEPGTYLAPFTEAIEADPEFSEALTAGLSLALQSLEKAGRDLPPDVTLDVLRAWNERYPGDARIYAVRGEILIRSGRLAEALAVLDEGIAKNDEPHVDLVRRAGDVLTDMGRHADALERYDRVLSVNPDPKLLERTAMQQLMVDRKDEAAIRLERVIEEEPARTDLAARLFALQRQRKDDDAAWEAFGRVFSQVGEPNLADLQAVNKILEGMGPAPESVRAALVDWYPPETFSGVERIAFARTLRLAGAAREAVMCLRSIDLDVLPFDARSNAARERLALSHEDFDRRFSKAAKEIIDAKEGDDVDVEIVQLAVRDEPEFWPARFLGAVLLGRTGKREEAVMEFDGVLEVVPKNDVVWYTRGVQLTKLERDEEAVSSFEKAIAANPNQLDYHLNLVMAHVRLGNRADARTGFDGVIRLRPDHPDNARIEDAINAL